jgi:hypothetical protein
MRAGVRTRRRANDDATQVTAGGFNATVARAGESKRLVVEPPWSQLTSQCQRFEHPPRLDN